MAREQRKEVAPVIVIDEHVSRRATEPRALVVDVKSAQLFAVPGVPSGHAQMQPEAA
jgi:hypothetical protein